MIGIGDRNADRPIQVRQLVVVRVGFGFLNPPLHLADRIEILIDPRAVVWSELLLKPGDVLAHPVEEAGAALERGAPIGRAAAFAEQPLEDDARVGLGRQGRRRRRPRQIVLIDARVAVVALADRLEQVHRQLQRRQQRLVADLLRGNLIDGRSQVIVGAFGPLRPGGAEERGVGCRMRAGVGVPQLQVGDDRELIGNRGQRPERGGQIDQRAFALRRPAREVASHRHVDETKPPHRRGRRAGEGGHRRNHGIEQRQRHRRAHPAQERPPRQCLPGDDHRDFLI